MPTAKEEMRARLLATFRMEAGEHLKEIEASLLALEEGAAPAAAPALLETAFRAMHTLKGAARSVSQRAVESLCQAAEALLSKLSRGEMALGEPALDALQQASSGLARLLAEGPEAVAWQPLAETIEALSRTEAPLPPALEAEPQPAAAAEAAGARSAGAAVETIRINTARLDRLILQSEELLVPKLASDERVSDAKGLLETVLRSRALLRGGSVGELPLRELEATLRELETTGKRLVASLERDRRAIHGAVDTLVEEMRRVRMMPAATMLEIFPRMVRDIGRAAGKDVACSIAGGQLEVDRKILEAIKDPLIHLIRNAIDHGVETPEIRRALGKPLPARIALTVRALEGSRIEITVRDDGRGIDIAAVRAAAVRRRLADADAIAAMEDGKVLELVYRSGLSTSPIVTDISGHGLGLAIVAERVVQLNGQIAIRSTAGKGTRFRIKLPASIATFRGLLVRAGGRLFLIAVEAVEAVSRVARGEIAAAAGRDFVRFNGEPVPLGSLAQALGLDAPAREEATHQPFVLLHSEGQRTALAVDEILGDREVLLKPLRTPLTRVRNIAAAGLLGSGEYALVLRPADLLRALMRSARAGESQPSRQMRRRQPTILVVDDSITTRTMEKNLFEAMGYKVRIAVDGADAWTQLATEEVDVVVSDVDMPRMNGFDLTARIRGDERLAKLPVVLVTALESREDKEQGIRVGANAYVIKSSLESTNLQQVIERFL